MKSDKAIQDYEKEGFVGIDADLETSLFEYGMIWKNNHEDGDTFFVYGIGMDNDGDYNRFDHTWINPNNILSDYDWVNWASFFNFLGIDRPEDIEERKKDYVFSNSTGNIIFDLVSYYGTLEIFGDSYWGGYSIKQEGKR